MENEQEERSQRMNERWRRRRGGANEDT